VSVRIHTAVAVLAGAMIGSGLMLMRGVLADREPAARLPPPAVLSQPRLLDEVIESVRSSYVEPLDEAQLEQAAVEGLLASLDPHSDFLDASEYQEMRVGSTGRYSGVGIEVEERGGLVVVVSPIDGSPAARAGLRPGDVILAVDGEPVPSDDLATAVGHMRGFAGSRVRLAVRREGAAQPLLFELERSEVRLQTVHSAMLEDGYGYVRIRRFTEATPDELQQALASLVATNAAPLDGLVLDLRGNPGGVLESSVAVADEFLDSGLIVTGDGRRLDARFQMSATPGDGLNGAPMVVLVDADSASGAEIVAGALRDHGRATLIGQATYGKGSVQTIIPLSHGQAIKLTTSRYLTPSGVSIHGHGLAPDILLPTSAGVAAANGAEAHGADPVVRSALQYLRDRRLGTQLARAGER
jgi:carboxyl-terminal processing protease